ncbi:DegT/DnrJ/EryC1/StrS family aminotransferase [Caulobacter sp. BK020]|uniref:DegT/DnrJ/EryC1/StrS family aminotransferase n=1 Tax=Caulobacter sp. BK020 TaxID=2512117 RepID=UPI00105204E3|nr:DegT/DnrJ/EryC1/StrS family aminotransferase [Caulobacter sp. BK020]TCS14910.1 dTDP-4-amino-4,6-dideoxygalactose transaminase [Caulobacter sp. BK020]
MCSQGGPLVPFFDWKALYAERADTFGRILHETATSGGFILQSAVDGFESALADYLGVRHVVGVSDCTNAMLLGLRASGLEPGDEVILPGHSFLAAAQAIHHAGGRPVPVELSEQDWLIDPEAVRAAITPRTRAVMAVHVNGRVSDMDALLDIAGEHGLAVYEDAAQALGACLDGRVAGRFGAWGAFSFYPSKTLGCFGDAGALITDDDDLAQTVRAMRNHGAGRDKVIAKDCAVWGVNSRLDNLHAAILAYKLTYYDETIARRRQIAARYQDAFAAIPALDLPPGPDASNRFDIFQNYEVCCDARDALRAHLSVQGIGTIVQWGGVGLHQFRNLGFDQDLPRTDRFFARSLLLPMNHLLTDGQVARVIDSVREFFA